MSGSISRPGVRAPGQGQIDNHLQASQMAHAAAQRAAISRVLAKGNGVKGSHSMGQPAQDSFKHHVLAVAGVHPSAGSAPVHAAIDTAVQAGHFTADQGAQLKSHDGPLMGAPGAQTIATLGTILQRSKAPT